jgi:ATP-dependent DNA helicase RecQ
VGELEGLPGMGPKRIENYGERIVDAVRTVLDG